MNLSFILLSFLTKFFIKRPNCYLKVQIYFGCSVKRYWMGNDWTLLLSNLLTSSNNFKNIILSKIIVMIYEKLVNYYKCGWFWASFRFWGYITRPSHLFFLNPCPMISEGFILIFKKKNKKIHYLSSQIHWYFDNVVDFLFEIISSEK